MGEETPVQRAVLDPLSAWTIRGRADAVCLVQMAPSAVGQLCHHAHAGSPDVFSSHRLYGVAWGFKNELVANIQFRNFPIKTQIFGFS